MKISRISKIKEQRIFRDFTWPADLPPFAQYNVIYGWNGTGKTTLSSIFANLQDNQAIVGGEVEFELDNGDKLLGSSLSTANVPPARVFNRDFVTKTIESIGEGKVEPIYFLGKESIEQQKRVEALKEELDAAREGLIEADGNKKKADRALDDFCIEKAKLIKEALLGSASHANYDKKRFKDATLKMKIQSPQPKSLSEEQKLSLGKQKNLQAKPSIPRLNINLPDLESLRLEISKLLNRSISSEVVNSLVNDVKLAEWVQQGLALHKGERKSDTCRFCGNVFSPKRLAELEGHFNYTFTAHQREIEDAIRAVAELKTNLNNVTFPDESKFYDHLAEDFKGAVKKAKQDILSVCQLLDSFKNDLVNKKINPFGTQILSGSESSIYTDREILKTTIASVNAVIDKHQETAAHLEDKIKQAYELLEKDYVLEAIPKFNELSVLVEGTETTLALAREKPIELGKRIDEIERQIVEHRQPAEELNRELRAYLGRGELQFEVKDTGYALTRGGHPAQNLSEGERTAIAFLYFLKSLKDKMFDLSKGIIIIDDPVSSLDSNALFSAFGYMKERTKSCHQLFILTHNFSFFRQIRNWFNHLKDQKNKSMAKRPARFYSLLVIASEGERNAMLSRIDPLLEMFETEYHFLFRQVYDAANVVVSQNKLIDYYGLPNIARRLVETFLAYRFPDCEGELYKCFERLKYEPENKTRILRFLHACSHCSGISEPEHDPSILTETPEVMKLILEMMEATDSAHFEGMENLMKTAEGEA